MHIRDIKPLDQRLVKIAKLAAICEAKINPGPNGEYTIDLKFTNSEIAAAYAQFAEVVRKHTNS